MKALFFLFSLTMSVSPHTLPTSQLVSYASCSMCGESTPWCLVNVLPCLGTQNASLMQQRGGEDQVISRSEGDRVYCTIEPRLPQELKTALLALGCVLALLCLGFGTRKALAVRRRLQQLQVAPRLSPAS